MLRHETVEPSTFALLKQLQALPFLSGVRLVGGTALALQLGHRKSVDLDLFGFWNPEEALQKHLAGFRNVKKTGGQEKMQFYQIDNVKVDFVTYPFAWLDPPVEDADNDLPPTMLVPFDWEEAKATIREAVRAYAR